MTSALIRERRGKFETRGDTDENTQRGRSCEDGAKIGVMYLQAKEWRGLPQPPEAG